MYHFQNDYNAMCHPRILERLTKESSVHMDGYGKDAICQRTAALICRMCGNDKLSVHFLSGGTQTNLILLAAALRPHQAVIAAKTAHIFEHETGAIEATGHRIIALDTADGKITAEQIEAVVLEHYTPNGPGVEHTPQPKVVYITFSTELGTIYSLAELEMLNSVCARHSLYLYIDGARLGYGLSAADCDVSLIDIARLADAFYIGGTKQGAMFGEAVVIKNLDIAADFRYLIKQRGAMLAKGWLMGLQFEALLQDGLYFRLAESANRMADQIRNTLQDLGCTMPTVNRTNQVFVILPDNVLFELSAFVVFTDWHRVDDEHRMVRFCTSWSTTQEDVDALCDTLKSLIHD